MQQCQEEALLLETQCAEQAEQAMDLQGEAARAEHIHAAEALEALRDRSQQHLATLQQEHREGAMATLRGVLERQGVVAGLLRTLTLQERAVAALLSPEDQHEVRGVACTDAQRE